MKIPVLFAALSCLSSAGCATTTPGGQCTDIIGINGSLLKFCQTSQDLTIYESGIDPNATDSISVVNNPVALDSLQRELPLRQDLKMSRKVVARSCTVAGTRYVNVSLKDLKRMMRDGRPVASDETIAP